MSRRTRPTRRPPASRPARHEPTRALTSASVEFFGAVMRSYAWVKRAFPMAFVEALFSRLSFLPRSGDLKKLVENLGAAKLARLLEL